MWMNGCNRRYQCTLESKSSVEDCAAATCSPNSRSQVGDENRWAIMAEHSARNFFGTTVGSWVDIMTRVARWRCWRMTVSSESVNLAELPFCESDRYYKNSSAASVWKRKTCAYLVCFIQNCQSLILCRQILLHKYNLPTILPDVPMSVSMNKPSIMSKNPQAEDPSINGDDKLGQRLLTGGTESEGECIKRTQ